MSSDNIMVDSTSPVSGTVYDGVGKYMFIRQLLRFEWINACFYRSELYDSENRYCSNFYLCGLYVRSLIPIFL